MGSAFNSSGRLNMRVFLGVFACVAAASATTLLQAQWSKFKADHGKVYTSSAEEALRMSILSAAFQTLLSAEALVAAWAPLSLWPTPMLRSSELSPKTTILMQVEAEETMMCASLTRPPRTPL